MSIMNEITKINELRQMIHTCGTSQQFSYAVLCWFIQYYCRFVQPNTDIDKTFIQLIEHDLKQELIQSFTLVGYRLILSLCSNFSPNSYFHLQPEMVANQIHKRLLALNVVAVFLSFKIHRKITFFEHLLFNEQRQVPNNYLQHLSSMCLPGLTISDPVITQMIDVRTQVQDRLKRGIVHAGGK
ncbi:unnamed protein product, partial [Adineta ricciae]